MRSAPETSLLSPAWLEGTPELQIGVCAAVQTSLAKPPFRAASNRASGNLPLWTQMSVESFEPRQQHGRTLGMSIVTILGR